MPERLTRCRRSLARSAAAFNSAAIVTLSTAASFAQAPAPAGGGVRVIENTRNFVVEGIVVVAFIGLAIYVVCRSSRRG